MEVVSSSDDDRSRDLETKREEYAQARIPEYWIVDPEVGQITVLTLDGETYVVHGEFKRGEQATSKLLPGFAVDVATVRPALRPAGTFTLTLGRIANPSYKIIRPRRYFDSRVAQTDHSPGRCGGGFGAGDFGPGSCFTVGCGSERQPLR